MAKTFGEFMFGSEEDKAASKKVRDEMRPKGKYSLKAGTQPAVGGKSVAFSRDPNRGGRPGEESAAARAEMDAMAGKKGGTGPIPTANASTVAGTIKKANADAKTFSAKPPIPRDNPRRKVSAERSAAARKAAGTDSVLKVAPKKVDRTKKAAAPAKNGKITGKIIRQPAKNSGKMTPYERMKANANR